MKNKIIFPIIIAIFVFLSLFARSSLDNTYKMLKNNKWYLVKNGKSYETRFKESTVIIRISQQDLSYAYRLEKYRGPIYLIISSSNVKHQVYKLTKNEATNGYDAEAWNINAKAKNAVGTFRLIKK
ncbi:hypothetical protein QMA56_10520 [Leuconostoc falkenbergense]|uniref:hypothetical protein n=1 Tax=Leuconostoc falkenbergense TaxID=2766470 RepID=UPI0024AE3740|nr:hypothetical protein [Leuconostoc falkenbergense]MDI6668138.1 hypothetical protein [Leuconostoc falkenbergense]